MKLQVDIMQEQYTLLLIDDEPDILEFISYNLRRQNYEVHQAINGVEGLQKAAEIKPDLILLDMMMPDMDGVEVCEKIREELHIWDTIIVFLSARGEDYSKIAGLEAGADDYITKPIKPKMLVGKIKSLLRRVKRNEENGKHAQPQTDIRIDHKRHCVFVAEKAITLAKKEFELLALLLSDPVKVFTRETIFQQVWGDETVVGERTIDVHIRKLRAKIGSQYIETIKGVGYKIK